MRNGVESTRELIPLTGHGGGGETWGGAVENVPPCTAAGMQVKAVDLVSSPAEGTSKCLINIWTRWGFSSLDSGTAPTFIGTSGFLG